MGRRAEDPTALWGCGHDPPILVEATEGGQRARCLRCGLSGPVREEAQEALHALKDRSDRREPQVVR